METLWFCFATFMLTMYVVLDGFDLGAGVIHLFVARSEEERRLVLRSIGPVWDGNEAWIIAAGGTLFFAFPALYASSLSGFYLPLMMVLWLLVLRGISIELRIHLSDTMWRPFWDALFSGASLLLAFFFGAALGNVVRGVPLDSSGVFFEPLWTDFRIGPESGILDWYTVLVGVVAVAALTLHGALWIVMKTAGALQERSLKVARTTWPAVVALTPLVILFTFRVQPHVSARLAASPGLLLFPTLAFAGLAGVFLFIRRGCEIHAFLSSCLYLIGMMASAAAGLYPNVLPAIDDPALSLTVHNCAAGQYGLKVGLAWWIPGMILVTGYFAFLYRHLTAKVSIEDEGY